MVTCEFNPLLGRFHDGELAEAQRRQVQDHLRECSLCAAELEQMQTISQSLRSGAAGAMPRPSPVFLARLQSLAPNVESQTVLRFVRRLTAAAAAILVAATIQWALHRQTAPPAIGVTALDSEERVVLDPESAVATLGDDSPLAGEPQLDFISQELSGGRQ